MIVLGISAFYHDSAAAILRDGEIVAAAQEERFTRKKHDSRFPENAVRYCLREAGVTGGDVDRVAYYEKPFVKFDRLLETYIAFAPKGFKSFSKAMPLWVNEKLFQRDLIRKELEKIDPALAQEAKLLFSEHHFSHAASAFYPSPFSRAAILTMDGVGEWTTTSLSLGDGSDLTITKEIHFPHSLGPALLGLHLLHRIQGQFRRIQGYGPRALWRAQICASHHGASDRHQAGRHLPLEHGLFRATAPA